jgi:DNA-directed RNA polymerase specialized sigma24 family protein
MPDPGPDPRRAAIADFYAVHARWLQNAVRLRASAPEATIEEACQTAWLKLLGRPDVTLDRRGRKWLLVVAAREARRMASAPERPSGSFVGETSDSPLEWREPVGPAGDPLELAIAHELHQQRVERLANASQRERRDLLLQAAGYSYTDLQQLTGSTFTAVNRRLSEGRRKLGADRTTRLRRRNKEE